MLEPDEEALLAVQGVLQFLGIEGAAVAVMIPVSDSVYANTMMRISTQDRKRDEGEDEELYQEMVAIDQIENRNIVAAICDELNAQMDLGVIIDVEMIKSVVKRICPAADLPGVGTDEPTPEGHQPQDPTREIE